MYGRVVAVGREMKGETVRGTWASSGCASAGGLSGVWSGGSCVGGYRQGNSLLSFILISTMVVGSARG